MNKLDYYVLTGISNEQIVAWKDDIRDDLTLIERDGLIIPVIKLSRWNAFGMKIQMIFGNIKNHYGIGLARI